MWKACLSLLVVALISLVGCATSSDTIVVDQQGRMMLNGEAVELEELEGKLKSEEVILQAHPQSSHENVVRVLQQVQRQGRRVRLSTMP